MLTRKRTRTQDVESEAEREAEREADEGLCSICLAQPASIYQRECKHVAMCCTCAFRVQHSKVRNDVLQRLFSSTDHVTTAQNKKCPICRAPMLLPLIPENDELRFAVVDVDLANYAIGRTIFMLNEGKKCPDKHYAVTCMSAMENIFDYIPTHKVITWFRVMHMACDETKSSYTDYLTCKLKTHGHRHDVCMAIVDAAHRLYKHARCDATTTLSILYKVLEHGTIHTKDVNYVVQYMEDHAPVRRDSPPIPYDDI